MTMTTLRTSLENIILMFGSSSLSFFQRLHFAVKSILRFPKRSQLPTTLFEWKAIQNIYQKSKDGQYPDKYIKTWESLEVFFEHYGLTLWRRSDDLNQKIDDYPAPSNYIYIPINYMQRMQYFGVNGIQHAARKDNRHYIIRVMSAGGQGLNNLNILRLLSQTFPDNLYSNNHILPMVQEIMYEDVSFGIFPLAFGQLQEALNPYLSQSTVEDVLHLVMQALEGIIYIHGKNIAHRDLFTDNFLIDFLPESLVGQCWTRPRVYLNDFETAIHFSDEIKPSERLVSGFPFQDFGLDEYSRKPAPELLISDSSHMYCPFSLDMFQFGCHLVQYFSNTGIAELDAFWLSLLSDNPADRPTAREVFQKLGDFISATPPKVLQITFAYEPVPITFTM